MNPFGGKKKGKEEEEEAGESRTKAARDPDFWRKVFTSDPRRNPCFRSTVMWGLGVGTLLFCHRFHNTRNALKSMDYFVGGFTVVGLGQYALCRNRVLERHELMKVRLNFETFSLLPAILSRI